MECCFPRQQSEQQVNQKNDEIRDLQRKVVATDQQHEAEHASWKEQVGTIRFDQVQSGLIRYNQV